MESAPEIVEDAPRETTPSRRTIVKAAAWSVPVIALAVAAPQASASTTEPETCVRQWTHGKGTGMVNNDHVVVVEPGKGQALVFADRVIVRFDSLAAADKNSYVDIEFLGGQHRLWKFDNYPNGNLNDKDFKQMPTIPEISKDGLEFTVKFPSGFVAPVWIQFCDWNIHYNNKAENHCRPSGWGV